MDVIDFSLESRFEYCAVRRSPDCLVICLREYFMHDFLGFYSQRSTIKGGSVTEAAYRVIGFADNTGTCGSNFFANTRWKYPINPVVLIMNKMLLLRLCFCAFGVVIVSWYLYKSIPIIGVFEVYIVLFWGWNRPYRNPVAPWVHSPRQSCELFVQHSLPQEFPLFSLQNPYHQQQYSESTGCHKHCYRPPGFHSPSLYGIAGWL